MEKKRVLLVEDDTKLRLTVSDYLGMNGFEVIPCACGAEARREFARHAPSLDVVLLDGMLPDADGFDILEEIRAVSTVPVIILSARESEEEQLAGFRRGADNYVTKPFLLSVLREHINALLSRAESRPGAEERAVRRGPLRLEPGQRRVYLDGVLLDTTPREYDLLQYFIKNERIVLDRDRILDKVWGDSYAGEERTVDTIVKQLRRKLGAYSGCITSVYGVGYRFEVKDEK